MNFFFTKHVFLRPKKQTIWKPELAKKLNKLANSYNIKTLIEQAAATNLWSRLYYSVCKQLLIAFGTIFITQSSMTQRSWVCMLIYLPFVLSNSIHLY